MSRKVIKVSEDVYEELHRRAGYGSVQDYLRKLLGLDLVAAVSPAELVNRVYKNIPVGSEFRVTDLLQDEKFSNKGELAAITKIFVKFISENDTGIVKLSKPYTRKAYFKLQHK